MIISKQTIFSAFLILWAGAAAAQQKITREEYIDRYKHIAVDHMERYGIPASITLAQGLLESANGNSTLAREANNHFGIKCHTDWKGGRITHDDDKPKECFRVYDSPEQSFEDHAEFLSNHRNRRYDSLFVYSQEDYRNWARGLKAAGYATAPDYAERLIRIIEENKLYLLDREGGEQLYAGLESSVFENKEYVADVRSNGMNNDGIDPDDFRVTVNPHNGYNVYRSNGVSYILAREGDTYEKLGSLFRIASGRLRKFNDVSETASLKVNDIVYIERKNKRWEGDTLLHTVRSDSESLYDIAQNYGIRVKPLARLNKLKTDAVLSKGRTVKLR